MKHSSVAIGAAQKIFLLCCMRVIGRNVIHMSTISVDLSADRTGAATD